MKLITRSQAIRPVTRRLAVGATTAVMAVSLTFGGALVTTAQAATSPAPVSAPRPAVVHTAPAPVTTRTS